eukprot:GFUD01134935.1.p1 GENE.GFUD01134935.1~~GFUD01134935.1.p1  ORF type:complete len:104 (+),score=29.67 GFUD01134935.1:52-363(+)
MLPSTGTAILMMKTISPTTLMASSMFSKMPWVQEVAKWRAVSQAAQFIRKAKNRDVMEARNKVEVVGKKSQGAVNSTASASIKLTTKLGQMEVNFITTKPFKV